MQEHSADQNQVRQLRIKAGVLKRNLKDFTSYKAEEAQLKAQLGQMEEAGKAEKYLRHQAMLIAETSDVLGTCMPRIEEAMADLENLLATYEEKPGEGFDLLKLTPEWVGAVNQIEEAKAFVSSQ